MQTRIQKWGNSQGLRIPRTLLDQADIAVGDEVNVQVVEGRIVLEPARRVRYRYKLKELLAATPDHFKSKEMEWGSPVGKEIW